MTGTGTVTIVAARPQVGRAGRMKVVVDGTVVGQIRQGASVDIIVAPGEHRFRVAAGGGIHPRLVVGTIVASAILGTVGGLIVLVPFIVALAAIPGTSFYLRTSAAISSADALEDAAEAAVIESGEPWWATDPALAKRYQKD